MAFLHWSQSDKCSFQVLIPGLPARFTLGNILGFNWKYHEEETKWTRITTITSIGDPKTTIFRSIVYDSMPIRRDFSQGNSPRPISNSPGFGDCCSMKIGGQRDSPIEHFEGKGLTISQYWSHSSILNIRHTWFLAASPIRRSVSVNATYDGVVRLPWSLAMISTFPCWKTPTQE